MNNLDSQRSEMQQMRCEIEMAKLENLIDSQNKVQTGQLRQLK